MVCGAAGPHAAGPHAAAYSAVRRQTRQEVSGRRRTERHHGYDDDFDDHFGSATAATERHSAGWEPLERVQQGQHPEGGVECIVGRDAGQVQRRQRCGASPAAGPSVRDATGDSRSGQSRTSAEQGASESPRGRPEESSKVAAGVANKPDAAGIAQLGGCAVVVVGGQ